MIYHLIIKNAQKKCPKCYSKSIVKNGSRYKKQRYKCKKCGYRFIYKDDIWITNAYTDYSIGKQTLNELQNKYNKSYKTIKRKFDELNPCTGEIIVPKQTINLVFDGVFFRRDYGFLVFRTYSRNIYWKEIEHEDVKSLSACFDDLDSAGFKFKSFTIDGRRGFKQFLEYRYPGIPTQFCIAHQRFIVRRYLTMKPKSECGQELKELMMEMTKFNRKEFTEAFYQLQEKYSKFLKERNEEGKFKHRRLRSAFRSIKTNLPYLFTYLDYPNLYIPSTTNSCEGSFTHLKKKIRLHCGLNKSRRKKMVDYLLENS